MGTFKQITRYYKDLEEYYVRKGKSIPTGVVITNDPHSPYYIPPEVLPELTTPQLTSLQTKVFDLSSWVELWIEKTKEIVFTLPENYDSASELRVRVIHSSKYGWPLTLLAGQKPFQQSIKLPPEDQSDNTITRVVGGGTFSIVFEKDSRQIQPQRVLVLLTPIT